MCLLISNHHVFSNFNKTPTADKNCQNVLEFAESSTVPAVVRSGLAVETSLVYLQISVAGMRYAIAGSFSTNRKIRLHLRNNIVHGIISRSHGACQQGAEVLKTICQSIRASISPSLLHSWLIVHKTASWTLTQIGSTGSCRLMKGWPNFHI